MGAAQSAEATARAQEIAQGDDGGYLPPLGPPKPGNPVVRAAAPPCPRPARLLPRPGPPTPRAGAGADAGGKVNRGV